MRQALHDLRREKILAAAHRVFLAKGFTRAKVEDIAKAARVANATVYTHFGAKHALFESVISQDGQTILRLDLNGDVTAGVESWLL